MSQPAEPSELQTLAERVIDSGALGRSRVYAQLLRYLVEARLNGTQPKEVEIAINVLGRDTDFDVSKDSAVRVYIHQLRKRLDQYYSEREPDAQHRLVIPRGQYTVLVEPVTAVPVSDDEDELDLIGPTDPLPGSRQAWLLGGAALLLLNLGLLLMLFWPSRPELDVATHPLWHEILADDTPILVVMGDYYIFGERNERGTVTRLVREFSINSRQDLDDHLSAHPEDGRRYTDLDLNYLPIGSAFAFNYLAPILHSAGKPIDIKMMSEVSARDLSRHHIVYIGYISGMRSLADMVFSLSGLAVGGGFDQLIQLDSGEIYESSAGLPSPDHRFTDFGWFITFPSTGNKRVLAVTGMRDPGLIHTALALTKLYALEAVDAAIEERAGAGANTAFEALYQVRGIDRMNFEAQLRYAARLDATAVWEDSSVSGGGTASSLPDR